jgi:hypothetical protein
MVEWGWTSVHLDKKDKKAPTVVSPVGDKSDRETEQRTDKDILPVICDISFW